MGIFSAAGEKNAARDMAMMDAKGDETAQDFTSYDGHDRSNKKVALSDGQLQEDEFVFFMLEQLDVKTDVEFQAVINTYHERIDQGERALKLRKIFAKMDVDGSGEVRSSSAVVVLVLHTETRARVHLDAPAHPPAIEPSDLRLLTRARMHPLPRARRSAPLSSRCCSMPGGGAPRQW